MDTANVVITIRDAVAADAPFIARCIWAAIEMLHIEDDVPDEMREVFNYLVDICLMDDTLYSYRNAAVAEVNGCVVGALVAYDGARYAAMRKTTFDLVEKNMGVKLEHNVMETGEGEFYLDSLAVMPQFRGLNIGKMLIQNRMELARGLGIGKVSILVDKDKPRLQAYYESLGFALAEEIFVFDSWYNKLVK